MCLIRKLEALGACIINDRRSEEGASDPKIVAQLLLARTIAHAGSIRLLVSKRKIVEARILVRCCVENLLWIANLVENGDQAVSKMVGSDLKHRRMFGERLLQSIPQEQKKEMVNLRQMMRDIKEHWPDIETVNPKDIADMGAARDAYVFYSELSMDSAHPTTDALSRHLSDSEVCLKPVLKSEEVQTTLWYTAMTLLGACVGINQIMERTEGVRKLHELEAEYQEIYRWYTDVLGECLKPVRSDHGLAITVAEALTD